MAGLDAAIGDYVVTLHPDFDPPAEMGPMVEGCRAGVDLVIGIDRQPTRPGFLYRALRKVFLALGRRLIRLDLVGGATGYRAFSRQAVNALVRVRQRRRYFAVVAADIGLTSAVHPYRRITRSGRRAETQPVRAVRTGLSVLVHNSITPLRWSSGLGLVGSLLSFLYSLYVVGVYLLKPDVMPGWTTLSLAMSGLFGLVFVMLALMGEYLGRVLEESTDRPLYHLRDEHSSAVMLGDLDRRNVSDRSEATEPLEPADGPHDRADRCRPGPPSAAFDAAEFRPEAGATTASASFVINENGKLHKQLAATRPYLDGPTWSWPTAAAPTARPTADGLGASGGEHRC